MSLNVLVVDDSGIVRTMIGKTLRLAGVPVGELHEAANGAEALALLEGHWVDLVFLDVNMPVMTGNEVVVRMKEDPVLKAIPIIVLTSEGSTTRVEEMKALGVQAYLRKPCTPEAIREAVQDVTGGGEKSDEGELVREVFCDVLQNLAYMICEPLDPREVEVDTSALMCATIRFQGLASGELSLLVPEGVCREIACNLLGVELSQGCPADIAADSLGEVLNVTCGHFLTAVAGEGPAFDVTVPAVTRVEAGSWQTFVEDDACSAFSAEGDTILLRHRIEETVT